MTRRTPGPDSRMETAEERRERFHDDYGNEGVVEADTVRDVLIATHRMLWELLGEEIADEGLTAMVGALFPEATARLGWHEALFERDGELYSDTLAGQIFHDLNAYAFEGIAPNGGTTAEERAALLKRLLDRAERIHALIPFRQWQIPGKALDRTMLVARGRWALDHGEPVHASALAILGGVSEQRMRNMISKTEQLLPNVKGHVPGREALDWLRHRPGHFRASIWKEQAPFEDLTGGGPAALERVRFVPVGSDGTVFHPGLERDGTFEIGHGSEERQVAGFDAALIALQHMILPMWRRPTPQGHWTVVQGVRWERLSESDLARRAETTTTA